MSGTCTATKRDGSPCTLPPNGSSDLCWAHDPKNAEKRRRGQSRGGRSKQGREIGELKRQLEDLAAGVLGGSVERGSAVAVNQILNTRARLIEIGRKIKETDELEARLEELERLLEQRDEGGRRWG
ncbi:MAG: hypothetical protein M3N18_06725 [Actinomycetota bacterium]|nr:hypothetical protein [Actinomycetota bacterium]